MSGFQKDWQDALAPSAQCLDIARLGEELGRDQLEHVGSCVRCTAELAVFRELDEPARSLEEGETSQWIADELGRRFQKSGKVVPFQGITREVFYAAAAALFIVISAGAWMQMREPSIDVPRNTEVYRGARLDLIEPRGDVSQPPNVLRWNGVAEASRYEVRILEADGTTMWSGVTTELQVLLPASVIREFAPGKRLLWEVRAFRGNEMLAASETEAVRVSAPPRRKDP